MAEALLDACSFCGLQKSGADAVFCTGCGRPLKAPSEVRSMDMGKTTANYDPYHRDWKPWREPTLLKKRQKKKNDTFYNKTAWGKNVPKRPAIKAAEAAISASGTEDHGQFVFFDHHEYGGVRFRGFTWQKPSGGLIRRRRKRERKPEEPFDPLLDSDIISPVGVYPAAWISPSAIIHVSLVEAIRVSESKIKKSKCWFRVGVTDTAWTSVANVPGSPLPDHPGEKAPEERGAFLARKEDGCQSAALSDADVDAEIGTKSGGDSDSEAPSTTASAAESGQEGGAGREELDDLLVLQYVDNAVARLIVGLDDDWVDAQVIDSKNAYMLEHLQRTLEPLAQRVVISSSRVVEESYDQLSFIDSKKISTFAILTMSNYFPYDEPQDLPICSSGHRAVEDNADLAVSVSDCKSAAMEGPATNERSEMQLYFDQTIVQTTVRIPLGEHYRGEYVTCMVRVEALNASPSYVSYVCRRLDIHEKHLKIERSVDVAQGEKNNEQTDEPTVAAFKFLLIPLIMKENIRPKVLVFSLSSLSILLERPFDFNGIMYNDDPESDAKQEFVKACLQVLEAVRFEKVRSVGLDGASQVGVRAAVSGVPNTFDVVDAEGAADPFAGGPTAPTPSEEPGERGFDAAASRIQCRWRDSFQYRESKREEDMQFSLAQSVIKIQCMYRKFRARLIVTKKRLARPLPAPALGEVEDAEPLDITDDFWRVHKSNKIIRTCTIKGTALYLIAELYGEGNVPLEPSSGEWEYILLTAEIAPDGERRADPSESAKSASVKLTRSQLLHKLYSRPAVLAPGIICRNDTPDILADNLLFLLTILTNVMPFLDLFFAAKKGIMIVKFNGPED